MKKTKILAILMLFVLAFTACTTPEPQKPTATAYGLQFEVEEDWEIQEQEGYVLVCFNEAQYNFLTFFQPNTIYISQKPLDEESAILLVKLYSISMIGGIASDVTATEMTIDGRVVWAGEASVIVNDTTSMKITIWMCMDDSNSYVWMYFENAETYDQYIASAQAVMDSIIFVGE